MPLPFPDPVSRTLEEVYRQDSRRVYATLARLLGDLDLAEEALHEAFAAAVVQWREAGIPANPVAWLVSTGRFRGIDLLRKSGRPQQLAREIVGRNVEVARSNAWQAEQEIGDDRLRLVFACCHPALDLSLQVPLTLREVCGLTTAEIATAFLTATPTMAQRIVRGKAKIRDAGIPISIPAADELPGRLDAVRAVVYLVFKEGYSASSGESVTRQELTAEAIRLGRLLAELLPDPESEGLLALMLFQESRRQARTDAEGEIILLEDQDRSRWDQSLIGEARDRVAAVVSGGRVGPYCLQAAIAEVHAEAATPDQTDWSRMVRLYDGLLALQPSPVVELNRAVAVAMRDGPAAGLPLIEAILDRGELAEHHLLHAARADLNRRMGNLAAARDAYQVALRLARLEPERRFLQRRLASI